MTREEALKAFTIWAATAAFEEKVKGTLEAGKYADVVVLSRDIMTIPPAEILQASVDLTVVGGEVTYSAGSLFKKLASVGYINLSDDDGE
jgi:predicted amidohydrolase YtcJ